MKSKEEAGEEVEAEAKRIGIPRTFWSKAYLKEEDMGVYRLYRDILVEGKDSSSGEQVKEKMGKPIPVGKPLREAKKGEEALVKVRTFSMRENKQIDLVEMD